MKVTVKKQPKSTVDVNVVVEKGKVKQTYDDLFKKVAESAEIKGFRKGQAPEDLVKQKTDVSKLYGEVINKLLQTYYPQALKENHINPIGNPKVEIKEFDLEKDFSFTATVAVKPDIEVGDYRPELKKIYEEKKVLIRDQNAEKLKRGEKLPHDHVHLATEDVVRAVLKVTKVDVAEILVDEETDRMMARLVDQAQAVGLSIEQYLKAQNKTADQLRTEYGKIAENSLKTEFALSFLIEKENIQISDEEVEEMAKASGDPNALNDLKDPTQKWYIKSILAKNKLITKIIGEVEKPHTHDEKGNKEE